MAICTRCKKGKLQPYSDPSESWAIHFNPWLSIFRAVETVFENVVFTDILKCNHCNAYGFVCSKCSYVESTESGLKHNDRRVCPKCRQEYFMRNPSNYLSGK